MYKYKINEKLFHNFTDLLLNIKKEFLDNSQTIHKARNELKIIEYEGINTIVKSFKVPNILNQIIYSYFRDSKAKRSYEHSLHIEQFTPNAIGYIEFYSGIFLKESYFISEKFDYDFTIREPLLKNDFNDRKEIFKAFARFTLELHNNNIYHFDYSPGNILIKKENNTYSFKIVDINRMKFFKLTQKDRIKNFSKLWADKETLKIIGDEYQKHYDCDENFIEQLINFSESYKKNKLKIKSIKLFFKNKGNQ